MQIRRASALLAVVLLLAVSVRGAQLDPELAARIGRLLEEKREELSIPGISVAVAVDGRLVYMRGFGRADLENSVPATADTVYRTASIAKPMTAVAVMQLAEAGKLDLDGPIQAHCPAYPEKAWPVTARLLLGHMGGVRHYRSREEASGTRHYDSIGEALELFAGDELQYQPGTRFGYSTYGYNLLGCAVEGASGLDFEAYLEQRIFEPAGMARTSVDHHFLLIPNRARGYFRVEQQLYESLPPPFQRKIEPGAVVNATLHDTSMKVPGGGLVSTAADLVRFALAVRGQDGMLAVGHAGGQAGTATLMDMIPERGLVVALMCNLQGAPLQPILREIEQMLLEREAVAVGRASLPVVPDARLQGRP